MRISRHNRSDSSAGRVAPPIVQDVLRSPGRPLDAGIRNQMEPRFGHDFSHVRVHTGDHAAQSAESINANAFATGSNIVFGRGQFSPNTHTGQTLLAHELAHTVQQRNRGTSSTAVLVSKAGSQAEREADTAASSTRPTQLSASEPMIARQPAGPETPASSIEEVLTKFLKEVKAKFPNEPLRQNPLVIKECRRLTKSDEEGRQMEEFLRDALTPGDPAALAKAVIQRLSAPVKSSDVERLKKEKVTKPKAESGIGAAAHDYVRGEAPKKAAENQQEANEKLAQSAAEGKERTHVTDIPVKLDLEGLSRVAGGVSKRSQAEKDKEAKATAFENNAPRPEYEVPPAAGEQGVPQGVVNKDLKVALPSMVGTLTTNETIQFKQNQPGSVAASASALRSALTPSGADAFDLVFHWLARGPEFGVQLSGMASLEGAPANRKGLSEKRVRSVASALIGLGIGASRIDDVPGQAPDCTRLSFGIYNCGDMHAAKPANPNDRRVEARLFVRPKATK